MADNKKYLWKAYGAAFLGLVLGLVGMHRLYLEYTVSGIMMLFILIGGIASLVYGYFLVFSPVIEGLVNATGGGANFNDIPDLGQLRQFGQGKWFNIGYVLCGVSLLWFWWICSVCRCWFGGRMIHTDSRY